MPLTPKQYRRRLRTIMHHANDLFLEYRDLTNEIPENINFGIPTKGDALYEMEVAELCDALNMITAGCETIEEGASTVIQWITEKALKEGDAS